MPLDTTFTGEDRRIQFQVKDGAGVPIPYNTIVDLVLLFYYQTTNVVGRFCKVSPRPSFTIIDLITDNANGIFEVYIDDNMIKLVDPSRILNWEMKVKLTDTDNPEGYIEQIAKGQVTKIEEGITRNIIL